MSEITTMNIRQVLDILPHRYPFLLIDKVLACEPGKEITALKNVTMNEQFFTGHFPKFPVMPGVLIIEALAQAAAILSFQTYKDKLDENSLYFFLGIDNARFKKMVVPGDTLTLHATITKEARSILWFKTQAKVGDVIVSEANLMCTMRSATDEKLGS